MANIFIDKLKSKFGKNKNKNKTVKKTVKKQDNIVERLLSAEERRLNAFLMILSWGTLIFGFSLYAVMNIVIQKKPPMNVLRDILIASATSV